MKINNNLSKLRRKLKVKNLINSNELFSDQLKSLHKNVNVSKIRSQVLDKTATLQENISNHIKNIKGPVDWIETTQNIIETRISTKKEEVFLSKSVIWARSVMITLISGTAFGIGWLSIAKTDEVVVVQGKLEPISGVVEIQMPIQGITKEILVKEGERVKKGQLLIELDPDINISRKKTLEKTLDLDEEILNRYSILVKEGAMAELQYLQQKNRVSEIKSEIEENDILLDYQLIKSPIDGVVFDLKAVKPGFVGRASEAILKIVPNDNLQAKVDIESRQIGFVSVGKQAEISIDSFPSTDFGIIEGEISRVGSDALKPDPQMGKGFRYPANIELKSQKLKLQNGRELSLQAGMSLTANIKLRKVSYLQLLLGTFQDKADSLKEI